MGRLFMMAVILAGVAGHAAAQLQAGDVAVIAYNTDDHDGFAWVALRDVPANTPLHFTDASVSNGWFSWGDHLGRASGSGPLTWISTNRLAAGSVVSWISDSSRQCWSVGSLSGRVTTLSVDGDRITAYAGNIVSNAAGTYPWFGDARQATLLFSLNFANDGWDNVTGGGLRTSFVPPGLSTAGCTAVHVNAMDNGYYSGITTGKSWVIRAALARPENWTTSDDRIDPASWPVGFSVTDLPGSMLSVH